MEAIRCVKRRLSDVVYKQMLHDALISTVTGPGRATGKRL
jgi:transposase